MVNEKLSKMYLFTYNETNWVAKPFSTKNNLCDRPLVQGKRKIILDCM